MGKRDVSNVFCLGYKQATDIKLPSHVSITMHYMEAVDRVLARSGRCLCRFYVIDKSETLAAKNVKCSSLLWIKSAVSFVRRGFFLFATETSRNITIESFQEL